MDDEDLEGIPGFVYGTNENNEPTLVTTVDRQDASDVFATIISREYPQIEMNRIYLIQFMRPVWTLKLPPQNVYNVQEVDQLAYNTQMKIYWKHEILVGYNIINAEDEESNESQG